MKKLLLLLLLSPLSVFAQTTNVTATVTDTDSTTWANGTWAVIFVPNPSIPGIGQYRVNGAHLDPAVINQNGSINGSGFLSLSVYQTSTITPVGSSWQLKVCPNASSACGSYSFVAVGSSEDFSSALTSVIPAPRFYATSGSYGYADVEAVTTAAVGGTYWNVSTNVQKCFTGSTWQACGGSSGSVNPAAQFSVFGQQNSGTQAVATAIPGLGADNNGNFIAPSVNNVWDLKNKFGATGSNLTIGCTATASSYVLTGCSSADFAVNQYVYAPKAGALPTISTPGAPTAACGTDGGTCTGTGTTYCYELVAEQNNSYGHGPLTAPSTSTCVTQPAQTAQAAPHSGSVDYYTTVGWTAVANQQAILIYKSISGGPYNFYELVSTTSSGTVKDFNHAPSAQFTVADLGWPATAPAGTTASDLYAQIASISGTTVTLEARTGAAGTPGAQPANTVSQPAISGSVTLQHDDSPSFAAAWVAERAVGGGFTISIPPGNYNTHGYNQPSGTGTRPAVINLDGLNNVTWLGAGPGKTNIYNADGEFIFGACGFGNTVACQTVNFGGTGFGFTLADPATVGSMQITLATPAQSSNFTVGGYITIFDNASGYPQEFYGEENKVLAINATTGVLSLAYPLNKTYSATLPAPYSACAACSATPVAYPIVGGMTATNITFKDLSVRNSGSVFLDENTIDGITEDNIDVNTQALWEEGQTRHVNLIHGSRYLEDPWSPQPGHGFLDAAAASSDEIANGVTYINPHYSSGSQECSEGSANVSAIGVTRLLSGSSDPPSGQSGGVTSLFGNPMCWNYQMHSNSVSLSNMNVDGLFSGDTGIGGSGSTSQNSIVTDATSLLQGLQFGQSSANQAVYVGNNTIIGPTGLTLGPTFLNSQYIPSHGTAVSTQTSGALTNFSSIYGTADTFIVNLSGNVTGVIFGTIRLSSYFFKIDFVQPASGGPFSLAKGCTDAKWGTGGSGIDCGNLQPPQLNTAASSHTVLYFWDDGTTVHFLGQNAQMPYYSTLAFGGVSGGFSFFSGKPTCYNSIITFTLTGNVTALNAGGFSCGNGEIYEFVFTGAFSLPATCGTGQYNMGTTAVNFINGICPVMNPTTHELTMMFRDDGTTVWEIARDYFPPGTGGTVTVASGTVALGTSAIASGVCATVVTATATGAVTTDEVAADFNADPTAITGYGVSGSGLVLTIYKWVTSGQVNFKVCNNTATSITPSAATLNWAVRR